MGKSGQALILFLLPAILSLPLLVQPASAQGAVLLQQTWGGPGTDEGHGIALDSSGNIYTTGSTNSFGPGSPSYSALTLLKYNPTGTLLWQKIWSGIGNGSDIGNGIVLDQSGNIYVAGSTSSFGAGVSDVLLLKFDPSGNLLWQRTWGGSSADVGYSLALDSSGNIYVTGLTASFGAGGLDLFLLKFDQSGSLVWQRTWGGPTGEFGLSVIVDSASNVFVTGITTNQSKAILVKFDSSGNLLWQRTWGGSVSDVGTGVAVDPSGNIYVTGYTNSFGAGEYDVFLLKFDTSGNLLWQKTWGGTLRDQGYAVAVDSSGNAYVTGLTVSFGAGGDVLLLKIDPSGNLVWQQTWGGPGGDFGNSIVLGFSGNAYIAGDVGTAPYSLGSSGNKTLGTPSFTPGNPGFSVGTPNFMLRTPAGTVQTVSGSQSWAGFYDQLVLEYGQPPAVTFQTNPAGGSLSFNGTTYTNGQSGIFSYGTVPIFAHPLGGYYLSGWTSTGGITVANPGANATTATISGSGTITANFAPFSVSSAPLGLSASGSYGKVVLTWSGPSTTGGLSVTGYKVYRGTSPGTETLLTALGNVNMFNDTSVTPGTVYYYKVTAINIMGESPSSSEANATPLPPSAPPPSIFPLFIFLPILAMLAALAMIVVIALKRRHKRPWDPTPAV